MNIVAASLAVIHWATQREDTELIALAITALGDHVMSERAKRGAEPADTTGPT